MLHSELETPKPRGRVWGIWPTIGFGLIIFTVDLLVQFAVAIIYYIAKTTSDLDLDSLLFAQNLDSNGLFLSIATITSAIVGIGLIILFVKLHKGSTIAEYLGLKRITRKHIFVMIGICIGLVVLSGVAYVFIGESQDSEFTTECIQHKHLAGVTRGSRSGFCSGL